MSNQSNSIKCLVCHATVHHRTSFTQPSRTVATTVASAWNAPWPPTSHERKISHLGSTVTRHPSLQLQPYRMIGGNPKDACRHISGTAHRLHQYEITPNLHSKPTPFKILGVSSDDTYATIKKAFLKIAMTNHPDMHAKGDSTLTKEEQDRMRQVFIEARIAFESLEETSTGLVVVKGDEAKKDKEAEDAFNAWFQEETGHDMPFMDYKTMKEVADMTDDMSIGLDRDGGMWTLAKMVTAAVRQGNANAAANILQLESGDVKAPKEGDIDGVLRRRRKPNRV